MNFLRRKNIEKLFNMIADFDEIVSITWRRKKLHNFKG
jgi:hypothetical protein